MARTSWSIDGPDDTILEVNGRRFASNDMAPLCSAIFFAKRWEDMCILTTVEEQLTTLVEALQNFNTVRHVWPPTRTARRIGSRTACTGKELVMYTALSVTKCA